MLRRALAAAAPVTVAGVLQLALGATPVSAATLGSAGAHHPSLLSGISVARLLGLLAPAHVAAPNAAAAVVHGTTAPAASASSHGLALPVIDSCVSCTAAAATPGHAGAGAGALRLLGIDLSAGAVDGAGAQSGALLTLPSNPLLDLALADWMASASSGGGASSGDARSALTDLSVLGGQVANLSLLRSTSRAEAGAASSGSAATDGVDLGLLNGALNLVLLHSDTAGDGSGHLALASINGTTVGAESVSGAVPVTVPGILDLGLLQVQPDNGSGSADVGTVSGLLGTPGIAAGLLGSSSSGAHPAAVSSPPASGPEIRHTEVPAPDSGAALIPNPHTVPDTGAVLGTAGLGLLLAGTGLAGASSLRRRRRPAVA